MKKSLPLTWRMVPLGACLQRRKNTVLPVTLPLNVVGLVGLEDIQDGGRGNITIRPTNTKEIQSLKTQFEEGDILYGKLRPYLNKVGIAPQAGICSTEIWAFSPTSQIDSKYVTFFLASSFFVDRVASLTKGANLPRLDTKVFDSIEIPLPPLSEQQRIVEILQEAEGLRRLHKEAETKSAGLRPALFHGLFDDPVQNPKRWDIRPLSVLINGTPKNGLYKPANLYGEGTPIIRIGDFTDGVLKNSGNLQRLRITDDEVAQFSVQNGQILINRVNSIEHLGKSILVAALIEPTVYESNMMRLEPNKKKVLPEYLIACLQHESVVAKLRAKAKKAINQASINQTDVLTLQLPVPPLTLQSKFALQADHVEGLRLAGEQALRIERVLDATLSANAFSGKLTKDWREANQDQLIVEAQERDSALKNKGTILSRSRRTTVEEIEEFLEVRTDGIYSELNSEQRNLFFQIQRMVGGVKYPRYFTAEALSNYLTEGSLRRNPHAVEGHLAVFAARGLIIPVSREEQTENTGEFVFGNCYRLPLEDYEPSEGETGQPQIGDHVRLSELERLVTQLEKERALK
ncbi:MAG: restriction endonuclease subunit S [Desulforhopalus sp.]